MPGVPDLKYTSIDSIPGIVDTLRRAFNSQKTKPLEFRLLQLRKLYWSLQDHETELAEACRHDLGKSTFEAYSAEIDWCLNDIAFVCKNLARWAKDEKAVDIPITLAPLNPKIRKDPLGCVLVIGAYNFPVQLALGPFIGAIAAGNTAVVKPSEQAPAVAAVLKAVIDNALDPSCFAVVQGAVPETTALLDQKWDKIFYTGSGTVGKIIAKKAAETLTPVTLELGGRNPAIVTRNADARLAARRLLWGKVLNAGQVCLSQNYTLVDREIFQQFLAEMKAALKEFYPNGAKASPDYGRIVNGRQWARLKKMMDNSKGRILIGGDMDESQRFIEPTVIQVDDINDSLIADESFGPLIPILPVNNLDQAIRIANQVDSTPLGVYPFGTKVETDRVLREVRSGGASVNDSYTHGTIATMPFGGVGDSGQGSYRGRASFDCFTHRRSVVSTPGWMDKLMAIRYPPYEGKFAKFQSMTRVKPNFDRAGNIKSSWLSKLLTLGAGSVVGGLTRHAVVLIICLGLWRYGYLGWLERYVWEHARGSMSEK